MNGIASAALNNALVFPEGSVFVRAKLRTEGGTPELLAAMIKRKKGFNPAGNDWEFLTTNGSATKIKKREKTGACQRCHGSARIKDFVFPYNQGLDRPQLLSELPIPK